MGIDEFELGLARNVFEECFESGVGQAGEVAEVDDQGFTRIGLNFIVCLFSMVYNFLDKKGKTGRFFSESFCKTCDSLNQ